MTHTKWEDLKKNTQKYYDEHLKNYPLETDGEYFSDDGERIPNPNPPTVNPIATIILLVIIVLVIAFVTNGGCEVNDPHLRCGVKDALVTCGDEAFNVDSVTSLEIVEHQSNLYVYLDGATKATNAVILHLNNEEMNRVINTIVDKNPDVKKPEGTDSLVVSK